MYVKSFLLVLVALVCLQAQAAPSDGFGDVIDTARQAIQKLANKIRATISTVTSTLSTIYKEFWLFIKEVGDQYQFKVQEESRKLVEQLGVIKDDAVKKGVDIGDCLKGREDDLKALPGKFNGAIGACIANVSTEAKGAISRASEAISGSMGVIVTTYQELDACGSGVESLACVTRLMAKIGGLSASVPLKVVSESTKIAATLTGLRADVQKCASQELVNMIGEGEKTLGVISDCASKK